MTLKEFKGFMRACVKKRADDQMNFVVSVAVGAQGNQKSISKVIKTFEDAKAALGSKPKELTESSIKD